MNPITRRDVLKGAAALGAAGAAAGPLGRPAGAQTTQKRELVVAQGGDIAFFDPHMSTSSNDIRVSFNLFDNLTSRRPDGKLAPGLGDRVEAPGPDDLGVQAPPRRQVPQRRPLHLGRRQVQPRADVRPERQVVAGRDNLPHYRQDRGAGPDDPGHPHQEARSTAARPSRLLRRPDRAEEISGNRRARDLQPEARRHGPRPLRVVDQGRQGGARGERRLLGRQARLRSHGHPRRCPRWRPGSPPSSRARWI